MRIGVDVRVLGRTGNGIRNYTFEIIKGMAKIDRRNEYFLYSDRSYDDEFNGLDELQKRVIKSRLSWPMVFPKILKRDKINLLFSPVSVLPLMKVCKSVITIHDLTFEVHRSWFTPSSYMYLHLSYKNAAKKADRIIVDSITTKNDLIAKYRIQEEKIEVVYLGIDHDLFNPNIECKRAEEVLNKYNIRDRFILYVGAINVRKNVVRLVEAFYKLKKMGFPSLKLVMNGGMSGPKIDFEGLLRDLNLEKDVIWVNSRRDEIPVFFNRADFLIYPSLYEGFGLPVLEAMACGTPVITSNTSSMPEVTGDAGILVDPYKVEELVSAMYNLLVDKDLRLQLKMKGLERSKTFTWERAAQETINVFKDTIN